MRNVFYVVIFLGLIYGIYYFSFKNTIKEDFVIKDNNSFIILNEVSDACEVTEAIWNSEYEECEQTNKTWCDIHQGFFNECASNCRHQEGTDIVCTANCIQVCEFNNLVDNIQ